MRWLVMMLAVVVAPRLEGAEPRPLSEATRSEIAKVLAQCEADAAALDKEIAQSPRDVSLYSRRGDVRFFLGRFADAAADYDTMVELDPKEGPSHWRRGIAYFYAGRFEDAAKQFEAYHSFDNVDRENGIWRFLSQYKATGPERAAKDLLKYEKDDREPFPSVYKLFSGDATGDAILKQIGDAKIDDRDRQARLFYAELYIGLLDVVQDRPEIAIDHLRAATENPWPRTAGYGPRYMWHVGRLQYDLLRRQIEEAEKSSPK